SGSHEDAIQHLCAYLRAHRQALGLAGTARGSKRPACDDRSVSAGQLRKHERFRSRVLRNQRDLIVYLPPGYADQPWQRFPVLYMQDGQNLFDSATAFGGVPWNMKETADRLIDGGAVQPLIIVGIYNMGKSRIHEYTPTKAPKLGGGRADRYSKFL